MVETKMLYEHIYIGEDIIVRKIECTEKPKTYIQCNGRDFSPDFRRTLKKDELSRVLFGYKCCAMYSEEKQVDKFKQDMIDYKARDIERISETLKNYQNELDSLEKAKEIV